MLGTRPMLLFELEVTDPVALDIFTRCEKSLQQFGNTRLTLSAPVPTPGRATFDGYLRITDPSSQLTSRYVCEAKQRVDPNALARIIDQLQASAATAGGKPLLMTSYISQPLAERLRARGIAYLDAVGNAYLVDPPIYIWLQGFRPIERPERIIRAFQAAGLQLIALLLTTPEAVDWPYRKLAEHSGLSLGSISLVLGDLRKLGFIRLVGKERHALVDRRKLLENWELGYATRLRPQLNPANYRQAEGVSVEELPEKIPPALREEVLVGGELAAAIVTKHVRPQTATFHILSHRPLLPIIKGMKLIPDKNGPIVLIELFGNMSSWAWEKYEKERLVHPFLIYEEVIHGDPDDRLMEMARLLFDTHLSSTLNNDSSDHPV